MTERIDNQSERRSDLLPAARSEQVVNYYFPVEIVVAGQLADQERALIQAQIYQDLHDAIIDKLA